MCESSFQAFQLITSFVIIAAVFAFYFFAVKKTFMVLDSPFSSKPKATSINKEKDDKPLQYFIMKPRVDVESKTIHMEMTVNPDLPQKIQDVLSNTLTTMFDKKDDAPTAIQPKVNQPEVIRLKDDTVVERRKRIALDSAPFPLVVDKEAGAEFAKWLKTRTNVDETLPEISGVESN